MKDIGVKHMEGMNQAVGSQQTTNQPTEGLAESQKPVCYFVVPCYNEEEALPETSQRLLAKLTYLIESDKLHPESRILFIDDGSKDLTWSIIESLHEQNTHFVGIKLARNRGHQNALFAGLMFAVDYCDISISLDADLQDDIEAIDEFIERYFEGCQIVFGVRDDRTTDTVFKRTSAGLFYNLIRLLGADTIKDHADYRLMSKPALIALSKYPEVNLFLRGMVIDIGYKTGVVYYTRGVRFAGVSKYPLKKMIAFAFDGITSFSIKPLRLMLVLGLFISFVSLLGLMYALISYFFLTTVSGWTTTILSIWFLGGIQVFCIGLIGEYVGKSYIETKRRPKYIIDKTVI